MKKSINCLKATVIICALLMGVPSTVYAYVEDPADLFALPVQIVDPLDARVHAAYGADCLTGGNRRLRGKVQQRLGAAEGAQQDGEIDPAAGRRIKGAPQPTPSAGLLVRREDGSVRRAGGGKRLEAGVGRIHAGQDLKQRRPRVVCQCRTDCVPVQKLRLDAE